MFIPNWFEQDIIDYMAWQVEHNGMATAAVARSLNKRGITGKRGGNGKAIPSPEPSPMTSTPTTQIHRT